MDDKIATLTKEVWTQEKSLTDKKARLMALLPYLQAAVEDITGMDNLDYTPRLALTPAGIEVREGDRFDISDDDTLKAVVQQLATVRKEEEKYQDLTTRWGALRQSFHDEMKQATPSGGTSAPSQMPPPPQASIPGVGKRK